MNEFSDASKEARLLINKPNIYPNGSITIGVDSFELTHLTQKSWLIWKDPDAGKDWEQEEKGMTEDEMLAGILQSMDISLSKL